MDDRNFGPILGIFSELLCIFADYCLVFEKYSIEKYLFSVSIIVVSLILNEVSMQEEISSVLMRSIVLYYCVYREKKIGIKRSIIY